MFHLPVADVLSARIVNFNDDEHMLEMGADVFGCEGQGAGLLKHDGDDVISYVPLSEQLVREENKQRRTGRVKLCIVSASKSGSFRLICSKRNTFFIPFLSLGFKMNICQMQDGVLISKTKNLGRRFFSQQKRNTKNVKVILAPADAVEDYLKSLKLIMHKYPNVEKTSYLKDVG